MPLFTIPSLKDYNYDAIMEHLHDDPLDAMSHLVLTFDSGLTGIRTFLTKPS